MTVPYAELHCHSNFSFLDGASHPEELVSEAARLGLDALALTDHDGLYGVVRFAETARALGVASVFGVRAHPGRRRAGPEPHRRSRPARHAPGGPGPRPRGVCPPEPGHHRGPPRRRGEGPADVHPRGPGPPPPWGRPRRALGRPDGVSEGRGPRRPHHRRPGRGGSRARSARGGLRRRGRGGGAVGPRRSARHRPQRRPRPSRRHPEPGHGGDQQRPLRHRGPAPPGHHPGRHPGPATTGRARRLAARRGHRPPALGGRAGPALRPVARRGRPGGRDRSGVRLRPPPGGPGPPRLRRARRPQRAQLAGGAGAARGGGPLRARRRGSG